MYQVDEIIRSRFSNHCFFIKTVFIEFGGSHRVQKVSELRPTDPGRKDSRVDPSCGDPRSVGTTANGAWKDQLSSVDVVVS